MKDIILDPLPKYKLGQAVKIKYNVVVNKEIFEKTAFGYIQSIVVSSTTTGHAYKYSVWPDFPSAYHNGESFKNHPELFREEEIFLE